MDNDSSLALFPQVHSFTTTVPGAQLAAVERDDSEIHLRALFSRSRVPLSVLGAGETSWDRMTAPSPSRCESRSEEREAVRDAFFLFRDPLS